MAKYRSKRDNTVEIEAVRFDGSIDSIADLLSGGPPAVALECEKDGHTWTGNLVLTTPDGEEIIKPGEWISTEVVIERFGHDDACFRQAFTEVV